MIDFWSDPEILKVGNLDGAKDEKYADQRLACSLSSQRVWLVFPFVISHFGSELGIWIGSKRVFLIKVFVRDFTYYNSFVKIEWA